MLTCHLAPRIILLCLHPLLWPLLYEPQSALILGVCQEESTHIIGLMEGAWWTFFKWLIDCSLCLSSVPFWIFWFMISRSTSQLSSAILWLLKALLWSTIYHSLHCFYVQFVIKFLRSVIYHSLHSVYVQWVIKWTKISLACIVVLQDPLCQALQRQAKTFDIRCRILFDCQFPMLFHVFDSLALRRYWSRRVPSAKLTRTQGFYLRLRLRYRISRTHSLDTSVSGPGRIRLSTFYVVVQESERTS